jgi:hypothetical protein
MRLVLLAALPGCFLVRSSERPGCPTDRTVMLGLQEEVQAFAGCPHASGVTVRTGATLDLTPLRELERIDGDLAIGPTVGVDSVALNGLLEVGGAIRVTSNGSLRGLFLPRLERAGRIEIDGNVVLTSISMPRLGSVQGSLVITDNHALEVVTASVLTTIGNELAIVAHPQLALLDVGRLAQVRSVRLEAVPKLPADVIDQVRAAAAP